MAEGKQTFQKGKLMLIIGTLTEKGISHKVSVFDYVEKYKSYWLNGGQKMVSKDKIMQPYSRHKNDLNIAAIIIYQIWCFPEDTEKAAWELDTKIVSHYASLKLAIDRLTFGVIEPAMEISFTNLAEALKKLQLKQKR